MLLLVPTLRTAPRVPTCYVAVFVPTTATFHVLNGLFDLALLYSTVLMATAPSVQPFTAVAYADAAHTDHPTGGPAPTRHVRGKKICFPGSFALWARGEGRAWGETAFLHHSLARAAGRPLLVTLLSPSCAHPYSLGPLSCISSSHGLDSGRITSARLRATHTRWTAQGRCFTALEVASQDDLYDWDLEQAPEPFERVCALPGKTLEAVAPAAIQRAVTHALEALNPDAVAITSYSTPDAQAALRWCRRHRRAAVLMLATQADDAVRVPWREHIKSYLVRSYTLPSSAARRSGPICTSSAFRPSASSSPTTPSTTPSSRTEPPTPAETVPLQYDGLACHLPARSFFAYAACLRTKTLMGCYARMRPTLVPHRGRGHSCSSAMAQSASTSEALSARPRSALRRCTSLASARRRILGASTG